MLFISNSKSVHWLLKYSNSFSGPSTACANGKLNDLSSFSSLVEGGWDLSQMEKIEERLVLPGKSCRKKLDFIHEFAWMVQKWTQSTMSTSFWGDGKIHLKFENCNNKGEVRIFVDDQQIAKSKETGGPTTASFYVQEGTILSIEADDQAIIRLLDLAIQCGKQKTLLLTIFWKKHKVVWADVWFVMSFF